MRVLTFFMLFFWSSVVWDRVTINCLIAREVQRVYLIWSTEAAWQIIFYSTFIHVQNPSNFMVWMKLERLIPTFWRSDSKYASPSAVFFLNSIMNDWLLLIFLAAHHAAKNRSTGPSDHSTLLAAVLGKTLPILPIIDRPVLSIQPTHAFISWAAHLLIQGTSVLVQV